MKYSIYIMDSKPFEQADVYKKSLELVSEYRKSKVQRLRRKEDKAASLAAGSLLAYAFREYAVSMSGRLSILRTDRANR